MTLWFNQAKSEAVIIKKKPVTNNRMNITDKIKAILIFKLPNMVILQIYSPRLLQLSGIPDEKGLLLTSVLTTSYEHR